MKKLIILILFANLAYSQDTTFVDITDDLIELHRIQDEFKEAILNEPDQEKQLKIIEKYSELESIQDKKIKDKKGNNGNKSTSFSSIKSLSELNKMTASGVYEYGVLLGKPVSKKFTKQENIKIILR